MPLLVCLLLLWGCGDQTAPLEPEIALYSLKADLVGTWVFTVPNGDRTLEMTYKFTASSYWQEVKNDTTVVWQETGVWDIIPETERTATLIMRTLLALDDKWTGTITRNRVEIQGDYIWIGQRGGYRLEEE